MVKVLVFGASGYIGFNTCLSLRQAGHHVFGVVRTADQGKQLVVNEIVPVIGDITDSKTYAEALEKVTVVIDNTMVMGQDMVKPNRELMEAVIASSKRAGVKKRYIYTSGVLVYGDQPNVILDENSPCLNQMGMWRTNFDKLVISQQDIEGVVVRPGFVYGKNFGRFVDNFFAFNAQGDIEVVGNPQRRWSWIHISDLADAYLRVATYPGSVVGGHIFNVGDASRVTMEQIREKFARLAGATGKIVHKPVPADDFFANFSNVSTVVSTDKLQRLTGWSPKFQSVLDDAELYYQAWKAGKGSAPASNH